MPNPPRFSLRAAHDAMPSHNQALAQEHDSIAAPLRNEDVPEGTSQPTASLRIDPLSRRHSSRGEVAPHQAPPREVHRSLYTSVETFDLIRQIAFHEKTSAQALYREGLLLMLQRRGHYIGKTNEDV
jgi:hypothetical protein